MKPLDKLTELLYENERVSKDIKEKPLQERHLRMYCEDTFHNEYLILKGGAIYFNNHGYEEYSGITLDNTKDLYEQSDSVIERILDFLIESKQG